MAETMNIRIDQGSRWIAEFIPVVEWLDTLSGYSARGKAKTSRTLTPAIELFDFTPYMSVQGNSVIVDIPASATQALAWRVGEYDFELFDGDPAHDVRFLQGTVTLDDEVTT